MTLFRRKRQPPAAMPGEQAVSASPPRKRSGGAQPAADGAAIVWPDWGADEVAESLGSLRLALRRAQQTCLLLGGLSLVTVPALLLVLWLRPGPVYFGMSQDMKLLPMTPLSRPVLNEPALKNWVAEAVSGAFNIDFLHWRAQLTAARASFTPEAFTAFALSLDREGHLPLLRQQRALMHAVVQGSPVITRSGALKGVMTWEFEVPLLVSYETSGGRIANNSYTVVCQVRRVPETDAPRGVAIASLVATRALEKHRQGT